MANNYTALKKGTTHTLVKGPFNYYLCIPNEEYKDDDKYLDALWSNNIYIVDVDSVLTSLID